MEGSGRVVNYGAFDANAEDPSISPFGIIDGDGSSPSIENLGGFEKTAGEGVTSVRVPFDNQGVVKSNAARLEFSGGGDTGVVAEGSWGTEASGSIALTDGSFLIAPAVDLEDVLVEGATVITDTTPPTGSLTVPARLAGLSEITGAAEDSGSGVASWQLEISPEGEESWQEACPVEALPLGSSLYGCTFDTTSYPDGAYQLRALIVDHAGNTYTTAAVSTGINNAPLNVALPTASGNAAEGQVLSAGVGSWAGIEPISYVYQWESCNAEGMECSAIEGATHHTYTPVAGVVGSTLRVTVSASNTDGSSSAGSSLTSVITTGLTNTTAPSISGPAEDGQTLTAEPGSWTGPEPISYGYQWQSCNSAGGECEDIEGASDSTYVLNDLDVAHTIRATILGVLPGNPSMYHWTGCSAHHKGTPTWTLIYGPRRTGAILNILDSSSCFRVLDARAYTKAQPHQACVTSPGEFQLIVLPETPRVTVVSTKRARTVDLSRYNCAVDNVCVSEISGDPGG